MTAENYNQAPADHKPRLKDGHPYRTTTRFQRDDAGRLARDEEGQLVPIIEAEDAKHISRESTPREREVARARAAAKSEQEGKAMGRIRRKLNKRQRIGDPSCPPSRDEDFPLLAVLRRDRNDDAISVVLEYRRMVALCAAEQLKGVLYSNREATGLSVEYRSTLRDCRDEVNAARKTGWRGDSVPGGEIEYGGAVKRSKGSYSISPKQKIAIDYGDALEAPTGRTESLHIKVTEDVIIERVDTLPRLLRIRSALGPLVDAFEDAVIGGQTLTKIGQDRGFTGATAATAGKAVVMEAINEVSRFILRKNHVAANDNYLIEYKKIA